MPPSPPTFSLTTRRRGPTPTRRLPSTSPSDPEVMTMAKTSKSKEVESAISNEELEAENAEALPDREAMSLVNANIAAPVNLAAALNVASDNSIAYANAEQSAPITQST